MQFNERQGDQVPATNRRQDHEEKRDQVLTVAQRVFVDDGFEATPMAAVARQAGVAVNTV